MYLFTIIKYYTLINKRKYFFIHFDYYNNFINSYIYIL